MSRRTIAVDDALYAWMLQHGTRETPLMQANREATAARPDARMQISPEQGELMAWLVGALGVRRAIEVGTFTGYSALRLISAMPADGRLLCCDIDPTVTAIAAQTWRDAGVADRVELRIGPAIDTLRAELQTSAGAWDLVFIDADKENYPTYVELAWALLRPGGVALLDNVLWSGRVVDPDDHAPTTEGIRAAVQAVAADPRWHHCLLPIGDGLSLLRKL